MEWTGARYADKPTVEVQTWIDASPSRVWEVVSDVDLMPTMSDELQAVEWLDGATAASVGARFVGRNKHESAGGVGDHVACRRVRFRAGVRVGGRGPR